MIRVFLILLACIAGSWYLANAIKQEGAGYVYIYFHDYSIETSFWFAALILLAVLAAMFLLTRLLTRLFYYLSRLGYLPGFFWQSRARQLHRQGMLAYLNRHWHLAAKKLAKAASNSDSPFLDYAMATQAYLAVGDIDAAIKTATQAERAIDYNVDAGALLQLDIAVAEGDISKQELLLQKLMPEHGRKPEVLVRAISLWRQQKKWPALHQLLPAIKKQRVLSATEYSRLLTDIAVGLMSAFTASSPRQELKALWKSVAGVHDHEQVIHAYCAALLRTGDAKEARKILELQLNRQWSELLIEQYGSLDSEDPAAQLEFAENFLPCHGQSASLLSALGEIAKRNGHLARARDYLLRSLQVQPGVRCCELLAEIAAIQQDHAQSHHYLRQALALAKSR